MATPTIVSTNSSTRITVGTSHTVNLPASLVSGNILLLFFAMQENTAVTTPSGWTSLTQWQETTGATCQVNIFYKTSDGTEGATVTVTSTGSWRSAHATYQLSGWSGTPEASSGTQGSSGTPDPTSLTPSGGTQDYLFFAIGVSQNTTAITAAPTNYTTSALFTNTTAVSLGVGTRALTASSDDPGTFTGGTIRWVAGTIVVFPVAASGPANLKSYNTNLKANIKSIDTNLIANIKSLNTNL